MSRFVPIVASLALVAGAIAVSPAAAPRASAAAWGYIRLNNVLEAHDMGIARPGAVAWDSTAGALIVGDRVTGRALVVSAQGQVRGARLRSQAPEAGALSTRDASTGHVYTLDPASGIITETAAGGAVVSRRNAASLNMKGVGGMAVAPTADTTDAASAASLYVSVTKATDDGSATGPGVLELSLTAPLISAELAGIPDNVGSRIKTIDTTASNWNPFSPDPSGIAYAGSTQTLVVADGEIDEEQTNNYPYPGHNVWDVDPVSGDGIGIIDTTSNSPTNNEPVGVAWDPAKNELYISRDGSNSRVWAFTRVGGAWQVRSSNSLTTYGVGDAEGIGFGDDGNLYVGDGANKEVWIIGPGPDGNAATGDDVLLSHFDTLQYGISDPEGIGIDHNTGHVWVLSHKDGEGMIEALPNGTVLSTTHFDFATDNPGGLDIAPSSSTTDDPSVMSAWVAQRGVDNNTDPNEKDGKIFEVSIGASGPPPPPPDPGANLLVNGDFESGSLGAAPPGWSSNPSFTTTGAVVHGGSQAGQHFSNADAGYTIEQTVDATAGATYDVSLWANPVTTTDAFAVNFKVQFRSNKAISTTVVFKLNKRTPGGWAQHGATLTAPAGTTSARIMMVVSSLKTTVYVDDISFAVAP